MVDLRLGEPLYEFTEHSLLIHSVVLLAYSGCTAAEYRCFFSLFDLAKLLSRWHCN